MPKPPITKVPIEPEHYIPIRKHKIKENLLAAINNPEERVQFHDFCRLIEGIYHFESHVMLEDLKNDCVLFNSATGEKEREGMNAEQIDQAQDQFLTNFFKLMEKGNFQPLTQDDYDVADEEDFLFNLPVKINFDKLDQEMIPEYFKGHDDKLKEFYGGKLPEFAKHMIIFRRAVGVEKFTGLLLPQKLDLLISRTLSWIAHLPVRLIGLFRKKTPETEAEEDLAGPGPVLTQEVEQVPLDIPATGKQVIFDTKYIDRIGPKHVTDTPMCLLRKDTIQEPTFKQLVILFRYAPPKTGRGKPPPDPVRTIHIKQFRDIPMADLEVVYPEKKLRLKTTDVIGLIVTAIGGVAVVVWRFLSADQNASPLFPLILLGVFGGYVAKIIAGVKASRDRYEQVTTSALYNKNLDNDLGVIFFLMDSLEEQEFKEAVLAYYFLWRNGPMNQGDLDGQCEAYMEKEFGEEVDFEVDDALLKLVKEKLVHGKVGEQVLTDEDIEELLEDDERKDSVIFYPVPLTDALRILDHKWDNFFTYNNDDPWEE